MFKLRDTSENTGESQCQDPSARRAGEDGFGLDFEGGRGAVGCLLGFCGRKSRGMGVRSGNWLVGRVEISSPGRTRSSIWADVNVRSER